MLTAVMTDTPRDSAVRTTTTRRQRRSQQQKRQL